MKKTLKILTLLLAFVMMLQTASLLSFASSDAQEVPPSEQTAEDQNTQNTASLAMTECLWKDASKTTAMNSLVDGLTIDANYLMIRAKFSETLTAAEVLVDGVAINNCQIISSYVLIYVELLNGVHTLTLNVSNENGSASKSVAFTIAGTDTSYPEVKAENASALILGGTNEMVITGKNLDSVGEIVVKISMTPTIKVTSIDIAKGFIGSYSWYRGELLLNLEIYDESKISGDTLATVRFTTPVATTPDTELSWSVDNIVVKPEEGESIGNSEHFHGTVTQPEAELPVVGGYTVESTDPIAIGKVGQTLVVKDAEGNPAAGVPVYGIIDDEEVLLGVTDENGEIVTDAFTGKGSYEIYVRDENGVSSFPEDIYCYDSVGTEDGAPYGIHFNGAVPGGKSFIWMSHIGFTTETAVVRISSSADMANAMFYTGESEIYFYHTSQSANRVNTVTATDLAPGVYYYQVGDGNVWSEVKAFTVKATESAVSFALTPNTDADALALVAGAMANSGVDYTFAIQTKSMIGDLTDYNALSNALNVYDGFGDLDVIHGEARTEEIGANIMNGKAYATYAYGNVFVAVINYTEDEDTLAGYLDDMVWDAKRVDYAWRILVLNRSADTTDTATADANASALAPTYVQRAGMDLVISGDNSLYARTDSLYDGKIAKINGTNYLFCGVANTETEGFAGSYAVTATEYNALYVSVTVDAHGMAVTVYNTLEDGSVEILDTFTKTRETCSDTDHLYRFGVNTKYLICDYCGEKAVLGEYTGIMALNERLMYAERDGLGYGWRNVNGKVYYFHPQTFFAVNGEQKIDGGIFVFENYELVKGVWIYRDYGKKLLWGNAYLTSSWYTEDGKTYYLQANGVCAVGTVEISHVDENGNTVTETYVFDDDGVLIGKA